MKSDKSLNVFYLVDKDYLVHFTVSLTSLLENNIGINISVYVIHDIEDLNKLNIIDAFFLEKYSIKINLKKTDNQIFNNFPLSEYISKASYFKLVLADLIPLDVSSGLYIDCDTVITSSLQNLINLGFSISKDNEEEYSLLAVSDKSEITEIERLNKLGVVSGFYFNAGVMLVNLEKWRVEKASSKLLKIAEEYKSHLLWHDQDILNIYFNNKSGKLNCTYNTTANLKFQETPVVIHFSGSSKPWHYLNSGPYKSLYWKYLRETPFKNERFEKITLKKILQKNFHLINNTKKQVLNSFK